MSKRKRSIFWIGPLWMLFGLCISACSSGSSNSAAVDETQQADKRPNILMILADDLGYSDVGAYGGEIHTPNIDSLAETGVRMTNFHANPTCSPTRAAFMSGTDTHLAGLGTMFEARALGTPEQQASEAYAGYLLTSVDAFPAKLREAGYHTYMAGKWHLANLRDLPATIPAARGFEKSFALMDSGASHYGDGLAAFPSVFPVGDPRHSQYAIYVEDQTTVSQLPTDFYSTTHYTDKLIQYIESNKGDGKPFFAYAAYAAPHWPLQMPLEALQDGSPWQQKFAAYEAQYAAGYDVIRNQRLARMKLLGLVGRTVEPNDWAEWNHDAGIPGWTSLTSDEQKTLAREMAVYAVMVEYMDYQIGRLLAHVDLSNTIIIFMSDNGAESTNARDLWNLVSPPDSVAEYNGLMQQVAGTTDNLSYENLGRPGSYLYYNPGWTRVSATPFRLSKVTTAEGGIRVPLIAKYPGMTNAGTINNAFATVMDLAPTFLEAAEADSPRQALRGASMAPVISGADQEVHGSDYAVGWELWDGRAYIQDDYKLFVLTTQNGLGDGKTWEMFDLFEDPTETHNLVDDPAYTGIFQYLRAGYDQYAADTGVIARVPAP